MDMQLELLINRPNLELYLTCLLTDVPPCAYWPLWVLSILDGCSFSNSQWPLISVATGYINTHPFCRWGKPTLILSKWYFRDTRNILFSKWERDCLAAKLVFHSRAVLVTNSWMAPAIPSWGFTILLNQCSLVCVLETNYSTPPSTCCILPMAHSTFSISSQSFAFQ